MKKNIFLWVAVFAVGAMSSCSVDKVVDQAEARYIGFDPFANKVTRATTTAQGLGHKNFSVFGRYDNGSSAFVTVFENKEVKWSNDINLNDENGSWEYTPLVPWVSGKNYQFAAIAPYKASGPDYNYNYNYGVDIRTAGTYSLGPITVDATEANQIDYMTATPINNHPSGTSPVSFVFNHILSKIDFIFKPRTASEDNTHWQSPVRIEITKIELADVPTTNTYEADAWKALDTPETNKVTFSKGQGTSALVTTSYAGSGNPTLSDKTFDWLVVPQGTTAGDITKTLTITCDVYDNATSGGTLLKGNATASVGITTSWAKNTYYTYTVSIGADILGENPYITFDVASVKDWAPNTSNSVDVTPTQP